ncbi:Vitamin B6 photo-protection and homoeostasis [Macleaya cordata]|uniref:Vitamin B6 photo-protection and homoeostasis n=1 Tax=Macleaya cordata TaxID=56857 RepID=A0A200QK47_MACCD|nr:Vitamin B6 photo-protection and homoeostasis [Macleaya cordata]
MLSAFCISCDCSQLQLPWTAHKTHYTFHKPKLRKPKNLTLSYSLKTSYGFEFEGIDRGERPETLSLPVVIRRSGKVSRYFWDGTHLQLVSFDGTASNWFEFDDGFRKFYQFCSSAVRDFFVPQQVQGNYMEYVKWKFLHRVFSSALQVLATQAMFRAMGVGFSRSLPSAAALNWVLKDGLGRLSRCIYTASLASAFDTNLKRVRFSTSIMFSLSIGVELLTPAFPHYFLLLATVANIAKQISLACYLATGSAVHRSFAIADNLGEVSAKAQIQTVCFDNLGLMLAALLNLLCKNNQRLQAGLPFVVYPIFSAIDLLGIYQGLKHVHLQTLTKDRLEIILDTWIRLGFIPSPAEVSKEEGIEFPWKKGRKLWPIRIGFVDPKDTIPKFSMLTMQSLREEDFYFICMETTSRGFRSNGQRGVVLCLREGAGVTDIIMGLLQACHIRKELLNRSRWEHILEANDVSELVLSEWFKMVEDSKKCSCTQGEVEVLKEELHRSGWSVKNILLSVKEQVRYSLLDD